VVPVDEASLEVQLEVDPDVDAHELDELTRRLRRELLELDVKVERAPGASPPPGARAAEATGLGALLVTLATTPEMLHAVINTVRGWLSRDRGRKVKLKLGDSELELSSLSSEQQERLISDWIASHAKPGR
jgi:hypothetical protein